MTWDLEVDWLVIGSGGAGLTGAIVAYDLGAQVLIVEKAATYGGTTATSGGALWVPNHPLMPAYGVQDSSEAALTYLRHLTQGQVPTEMLEAYVRYAPRMVAYLLDRTYYRAQPMLRYPDYYPEVPGALPGGRSLDPLPFDGRRLGPALRTLRPPHPQELVLGRFSLTAQEAHLALFGGWRGVALIARQGLRYVLSLAHLRYGRDPRLTLGNALIGRLMRSVLDRGIPLRLRTAARELVLEGERVVGAVLEGPQGVQRVRSRRGVLLAAGGFARNPDLRQRHHGYAAAATWSAAIPEDTGDALALARQVEAALGWLDEAWWNPTTLPPGEAVAWLLVIEKGLPFSLIVDGQGRRFTNESAPYLDVGRAQRNHRAIPAYLILDAEGRRRYPLGPLLPGKFVPRPFWPRRLRHAWIVEAPTLEALARRLDIPPENLRQTVEAFNRAARRGEDPDFGRGRSLYDRYYADPTVRPNPALAPLTRPPFYAIPVYPGDLGTKGGVRTTPWGQAIHQTGGPIPGLYAAGNSMASPMGPTYPGAGGTLGPALTFAYLAAHHALGVTP